MEATVVNFRKSVHVQTGNQLVLKIKGISDRKQAAELVGKTVTWTSPAKRDIIGKVSSAHGNKGAVRAIFEKGMPGQVFGTKVKIE